MHPHAKLSCATHKRWRNRQGHCMTRAGPWPNQVRKTHAVVVPPRQEPTCAKFNADVTNELPDAAAAWLAVKTADVAGRLRLGRRCQKCNKRMKPSACVLAMSRRLSR